MDGELANFDGFAREFPKKGGIEKVYVKERPGKTKNGEKVGDFHK